MPKLAFWDVDTQNDYMLPQGRHYLKGAETLRPSLRKLYATTKVVVIVVSVVNQTPCLFGEKMCKPFKRPS